VFSKSQLCGTFPWNIKKKSFFMQKVLVQKNLLGYNVRMQIQRLEDLSPADLQDYFDWLDKIMLANEK